MTKKRKYNKITGDGLGLNLISGYAPDSFLKPVMLISTVFSKEKGGERSTAICFGEALNRFHLMEKVFVQKTCYERAGWGNPRENVSGFIIIKKHKTWKEAYKYHIKLITELNWEKYLRLYEKFCPDKIKNLFEYY